MKRIFLTLSLLVLICGAAFGWIIQQTFCSGEGESAPSSYSDITHFYTFEETGSPYHGSNDCSDEDTTPFLEDWTNDSTYHKVGSNGGYNSGGNYSYISWDNMTSTDVGSMRLGVWVYFDAYDYSKDVVHINDGSNDYDLEQANGIDLEFTLPGNDLSCNTNLSEDTWYFLEIAIDETAETITIYIDGVQKCQRTDSFAAGNLTNLKLGNNDSTSEYQAFDNLMISTDPTRDFCGLDGTCQGLADDTSKPTGACDD